jgi:hypothetical protein
MPIVVRGGKPALVCVNRHPDDEAETTMVVSPTKDAKYALMSAVSEDGVNRITHEGIVVRCFICKVCKYVELYSL